MEEFIDIVIVGIDENRQPRIRKEPYIDLYFKLSRKAPKAWCSDFNDSLARHASSPKIKPEEGLFIETWVRTPDEIPAHLKLLQGKAAECNVRYAEKLRLAASAAGEEDEAAKTGGGEQGRLNRIIAGLEFEKAPDAPS